MRDFDEKRVVYYGRNDYAAGVHRDRCLSVLASAEIVDLTSINEAIEAHQINLTVEGIPELFLGQSIEDHPRRATILFSKACRLASSELENKSIGKSTIKLSSSTGRNSGSLWKHAEHGRR